MVLEMENHDRTCRFCFKYCDGKLKSIEGSLEEMLDTLLLQMNSSRSESHFVCISCENVLNRCFEFKSTCLFMQTNIISNIDINNTRSNPKGLGNSEELTTCRLCMSVLKSFCFISLNNADEEMLLNQVFERCIPELDLSVGMKPAICKACYGHLQIYFNVMRTCSILEKTTGDDKGLISPQDLPKSTSPKDVCKENENDVGVIKIEEILCEKKESEFDNKDYMETDASKSIGMLKFASGNLLTGNDSTGLVKIKTEETFCLTAPQDKPKYISGEIYEANEIKVEKTPCEEEKIEFNPRNHAGMEDTNCPGLVQFTSMNVTSNGVIAGDGIKTEEMFDDKLEIKGEVKPELFFVDHEFNNVPQFSPKYTVKCEEGGIENVTAIYDKKFISNNNEKNETVRTIQRNFDSATRDPPDPVTNEISEKRQCFNPLFHLAETLISKPDEECQNDFERPETVADLSGWTILLPEHKNSSSKQILIPEDPSEEAVFKNTKPEYENNSKTRFQCKVCPYRAQFKYQIKCHSLVHKDPSEVIMYRCESCPYQTKYKSGLAKHIQCVHKNPLFNKIPLNMKIHQCKYCPFQTRNTTAFFKHLTSHKKKASTHILYHCDFCSFKSATRAELSKHKVVHKDAAAEMKIFRCHSCSFQTIHKSVFTRHSLKHENLITAYQYKPYMVSAKSRSALHNHKWVHRKEFGIARYECAACKFRTNNKETVELHYLTHKDSPTDKNNSAATMYECEYCSYQVKYKYRIQSHSLFKCESCSFQTKHKKYLVRHAVIHKNPSDSKIYRCDHCPFQTLYKTSHIQHLLGHNRKTSTDKVFRCNFCSFQSTDNRGLSIHMVVHKNPSEKEVFCCEICPFQTTYTRVLTKHILQHENSSPITIYPCEVCSYEAKSKEQLEHHLLMHQEPSDVIMF